MFLLVPAHPGRPGQRAVKRLCVCVCNLDAVDGSCEFMMACVSQLSLLPSVGWENEYRPRAVTFCGWGGNGELWKRCGLPSITPGASPLPAQDHETEMSTAPWRRIVCVCDYADQRVNLPFSDKPVFVYFSTVNLSFILCYNTLTRLSQPLSLVTF